MTYKHGQWAGGTAKLRTLGSAPLQRENGRCRGPDVVRQKIKIESMDRNELFYVAPYMAIERSDPDITIDHALQRLQRTEHHPLAAVHLHLGHHGDRRRRAIAADAGGVERFADANDGRCPTRRSACRTW